MKIQNKQIPLDAITLIKLLNKAGYEGYLVGGCVRDLIMDIKPNDFDMCTNATPTQIKVMLNKNGLKFHSVGEKYGTITVLMGDNEYEITTYRSESNYNDGRHPEDVKFETDIHKDLERRDFTINALAYNPVTDELIDDFGGVRDINTKTIKCVGNPNERFNEDALRILRALRFAIKYDFKIDYVTIHAMLKKKDLIDNLSKERITKELKNMLTCGQPICENFTIYREIVAKMIPELRPCFNFNQRNKWHKHDIYTHILNVVDNCKTNKFEIKLAALLHDIGKPKSFTLDDKGYGHFYGHPVISHEMSEDILRNHLRLTVEERQRVLELILNHDMKIPLNKNMVKKILNKFPEDYIMDWMILKQADIDDHDYSHVKEEDRHKLHFLDKDLVINAIKEIKEENECFKIANLNINGKQIMEILNIKPGKEVGIILNALLENVIDENINNDFDDLRDATIQLYQQLQMSAESPLL